MLELEPYYKDIQVIWADLDPNMHMRHTAYSDYATHARICFFVDKGYPLTNLTREKIGPVLLHESSRYWREVGIQEHLRIKIELERATEDYSHYTIRHTFIKNNKKRAARVVIDGAWMDLQTRQLITPPDLLIKKVLDVMPKTKDFEIVGRRTYIFL
ncbi:MAG: thioesterase family protein [Saprospiraceae bacterium]|nr:thioesterase family protein [Saprospiraceae bacterium]